MKICIDRKTIFIILFEMAVQNYIFWIISINTVVHNHHYLRKVYLLFALSSFEIDSGKASMYDNIILAS